MNGCWAALTLAMVAAFASRGSTSAAPPVSAAMLQSGARQRMDPASLTSGRTLYLNRCARCHRLPAAGGQRAEDWPRIIAVMSRRSGLKAEQAEQVLAYIMAARRAKAGSKDKR